MPVNESKTTSNDELRQRIMNLKPELPEEDKIICDLAWRYLADLDRKQAAAEENLMMCKGAHRL